MTFAYYAGPDAVKGLQRLHEKGERVSKNALKKLEGIIFPEFYKKVAAEMQDERTTLQSLQKSIDTIIIEQWVVMHLDHPQNIQYVRPEKGVYGPELCFHTAVYLFLLLCFVAKDMRTRAEVAALGKPAKKKRRRNRKSPKARQQRKRQRDQGPRRAGLELHSSSQLVSPHQENNPQSHLQRVRRPWLNLWVLRCRLFRRKSNFFVCCDILCARARARHCSSTTFLLSLCAARFTL